MDKPQTQYKRATNAQELIKILRDYYHLDTKDFVQQHGLGWSPLIMARAADKLLGSERTA